jgi:hypothetical protein
MGIFPCVKLNGGAKAIRLGLGCRKDFFPAEERIFDFCVIKTKQGYEAVLSQVFLGKGVPLVTTGLWWCQAKSATAKISDWSKPVQIMGMSD